MPSTIIVTPISPNATETPDIKNPDRVNTKPAPMQASTSENTEMPHSANIDAITIIIKCQGTDESVPGL